MLFKRKRKRTLSQIVLEKLREKIKTVTGNEIPIYNFPFDLSPGNKKIYGLCAITKEILLVAKTDAPNGEIILETYNIEDLYDVNYTKLYGAITFEYRDKNGVLHEICRATSGKKDFVIDGCRYVFTLHNKNEIKKRDKKKLNTCPKCGRPYRRNSSTCLHCGGAKKALKNLFNIAKPYTLQLMLSMVLFFIVSLLNILIPAINKYLIDDVIKAPNAGELGFKVLFFVVLSIALTQLFINIFSVLRNILMLGTSSKMLVKIRSMLFSKVQKMSIGRISEHTPGDLITRITSDTQVLNSFLTYDLPECMQQAILLTGVLIFMLIKQPVITLLAVIPCPFVVIMFNVIHKLMGKLYRRQWFIGMKANSIMHDIFQGIRVVKVFGMEDAETEKYGKTIFEEARIRQRNETLWNLIIPSANFLMGVGEFIVVYFVGIKILDPSSSMTLGDLTQMTSYITLLYGPLRYFSRLPRKLVQTATSTVKIFEIIDEEDDVADIADAKEIDIQGHVEFKDVSFGYNENEKVLENISFTAEKGEMIGIVGLSGTGKSTLINLLMRLYDVDSGQILIDGVDIRDIAQESLRRQTGVVLQETFLFTGTIYDNIAYAAPKSTRDEVIRAAKLAGAHKFIIKLPDAYNTIVGERGFTLSGGERQRIAIARAILCNPKILILDEATSALDTITEKNIQDALSQLTKNRTTFAIAHRLSTLRNATKLIVLDKGEIAEVGTHDELIRKKGIYYSLVMAQRQMSKMS
ncbi:MAG: ABC transporter ATP-binding protein [Ruminococcaceae bacterium]|nr:ABC transporter ATP-binding protein [Oscillospiraceae bacterium]